MNVGTIYALGEGTTLPVPGTPSSLGPQKTLTPYHLTLLRLPPKLCSMHEWHTTPQDTVLEIQLLHLHTVLSHRLHK